MESRQTHNLQNWVRFPNPEHGRHGARGEHRTAISGTRLVVGDLGMRNVRAHSKTFILSLILLTITLFFPIPASGKGEIVSKTTVEVPENVETVQSTSLAITPVLERPSVQKQLSRDELDARISYYAQKWGVSAEKMKAVISGESNYRCTVYGDDDKAFGIAQFHRSTFDSFSKEMGETLNYYSCENQIELMAYAFSRGWQNHWTVYRNLLAKSQKQ